MYDMGTSMGTSLSSNLFIIPKLGLLNAADDMKWWRDIYLHEIYSYRKRHVFKVIEGGKNNLIATAFQEWETSWKMRDETSFTYLCYVNTLPSQMKLRPQLCGNLKLISLDWCLCQGIWCLVSSNTTQMNPIC